MVFALFIYHEKASGIAIFWAFGASEGYLALVLKDLHPIDLTLTGERIERLLGHMKT